MSLASSLLRTLAHTNTHTRWPLGPPCVVAAAVVAAAAVVSFPDVRQPRQWGTLEVSMLDARLFVLGARALTSVPLILHKGNLVCTKRVAIRETEREID